MIGYTSSSAANFHLPEKIVHPPTPWNTLSFLTTDAFCDGQENGQGFIHPDDVAAVSRLLPSPRVFKRTSFDGTYYHYSYGSAQFRLRPAMWLKVAGEGVEIGDQVETIGFGARTRTFRRHRMGHALRPAQRTHPLSSAAYRSGDP